MSSKLGVENIAHTNGTNAMTIASDGSVNMTGHVLQVKQAVDSSQRTVNSTSWGTYSNTLSVDITPTSASSKFLVSFCTNSYNPLNLASLYLTIYRDSTRLDNSFGFARNYTSSSDISVAMVGQFLDSPNTTSQITYAIYARTDSGGTAYFNSNVTGTITVMEIGA